MIIIRLSATPKYHFLGAVFMRKIIDFETLNFFYQFYSNILIKKIPDYINPTKAIRIIERALKKYPLEVIRQAYFEENLNYFLIDLGYYDYSLNLSEFLIYSSEHTDEFEKELFENLKNYCGY